MSGLLLKFLREVSTPRVWKLILDVVEEQGGLKQRDRCRFEFNRFVLTRDVVNDTATLEEVLDRELSGEFRLRLGEPVRRLSEDSR
ncbi:hypothetical protein [Methyloversatilis sp.]|uniref:hypothetical protein n=1 Tax=Methyloversatilis sp. TaxID=2569862 RepID=UPI0035B0D3EF